MEKIRAVLKKIPNPFVSLFLFGSFLFAIKGYVRPGQEKPEEIASYPKRNNSY
ncbi:hypothetical protein [Methanoregula sp. PtaB.Bin085]|uniref:hypothetical protein n=1 Tax=Methanoregula sp. PtaB.Bin085 TaxID=1811680 RepID=UPI0025D8EA5E|nr:hypothetical protein [Methanoregula sp. PtaB.Bin085]